MNSQIAIIPSYRIDKIKWADCIHKSGTDLIYAQDYYLEALADNWHGIVVDDYRCVMPIPWRKKLGIRYCYDVPFIQQLGYFDSSRSINHIELMDSFLDFIKYGHYNFNYSNHPIGDTPGVKNATNIILEMESKESITGNFTKSFKQSLQRSLAYDLQYIAALPAEPIEMHKELYKKQKTFRKDDHSNFMQLSQKLMEAGKCFARKIINNEGHTLAVVLLLKDERRVYNMINVSTEEGRKKEANYLLYSKVLEEFAGKGLLFDLEGSELVGVKNFYKKFGAINQPYYRMKINNLPFPLKQFTR